MWISAINKAGHTNSLKIPDIQSRNVQSRAHICHKYHKLYSRGKKCQVEKFWEILGSFEKFWEILGDFATIYALSCEKKIELKKYICGGK